MKTWQVHIIIIFFVCFSCDNESVERYFATPSSLDIPKLFEDNILAPVIPIDNPQTVEGIALGKKLFFDPILSIDNTLACVDCHAPENAFTDSDKFSDGVDGIFGNRNSMPLFNLAWNYDEKFFWDGNTFSLEHQAFVPVTDPFEMKSNWADVESKLQQHAEYPSLFEKAFGASNIDSSLVTKAIAQFERTLISANSKFDKFLFAISNALLGSIHISFLTFGATDFAHLPVPQPKSNPIDSLEISLHGNTEKYSLNKRCCSVSGKLD